MKKYNVFKEVSTEKNTENHELHSYETLKEAEIKFNEILSEQEVYAGEFNEGDFSEYYQEEIKIESVDQDENYVLEKKNTVYIEGVIDKNNWKGESASNYWQIARFNGKELIHNFYNNRNELNLEYENIKDTELKKWFNYK